MIHVDRDQHSKESHLFQPIPCGSSGSLQALMALGRVVILARCPVMPRILLGSEGFLVAPFAQIQCHVWNVSHGWLRQCSILKCWELV